MPHKEKYTEIHVLDFIRILVDARRLILKNFMIAVIIAIILAFVLPKKYTAISTLMPPQDTEKLPMSQLLSESALPGLGLALNQSSTSEILVEILKSRSVKELVLQRRFLVKDDSVTLYEHLGFSSQQRAIKKLVKRMSFVISKSGVITISADMETAQLAADVANAYVAALDQVNQEKSVSRAKNSRIYLESQLKENNEKLDEATRELARFQQENKAVALNEQMAASIQQAGEMKGRIIAKEVELGVMLQTMKPQNPLVTRAQKELEELNRRYHELQFGEPGIPSGESEFYVPFTDVPEVGLALAKLTRDVKVQETVWQLLNQQYYQAKIEEARNTPTVQVLDIAVPPIIASWPRKKVVVILFGLASILFTIVWVFWVHYMGHLKNDPEENARLTYITGQFRSDWQQFKARSSRQK